MALGIFAVAFEKRSLPPYTRVRWRGMVRCGAFATKARKSMIVETSFAGALLRECTDRVRRTSLRARRFYKVVAWLYLDLGISRTVESSGSSLLIAHWSFRWPCHVNWLLYVTIKESWNTKQTNSWMSSREKAISFMINLRSCYGQSFFLSFSFFFLTMAPQVLEKKIALLFTYRKIVIIFKSVELEHTPSSFPRSKRWSATVQPQKKRKKAALVGFIHISSLTTGSPLQEQQEKVKSQQLKQVCI